MTPDVSMRSEASNKRITGNDATMDFMAKKLITRLIDDIDGAELDDGGESIAFSFDGHAYEIDLSDANAEKLRDALAPFIKAARRTGAPASTPIRGRRATSGRSDLAAVRAWANDNGMPVSDRGRVPSSVLEAYDAAH